MRPVWFAPSHSALCLSAFFEMKQQAIGGFSLSVLASEIAVTGLIYISPVVVYAGQAVPVNVSRIPYSSLRLARFFRNRGCRVGFGCAAGN